MNAPGSSKSVNYLWTCGALKLNKILLMLKMLPNPCLCHLYGEERWPNYLPVLITIQTSIRTNRKASWTGETSGGWNTLMICIITCPWKQLANRWSPDVISHDWLITIAKISLSFRSNNSIFPVSSKLCNRLLTQRRCAAFRLLCATSKLPMMEMLPICKVVSLFRIPLLLAWIPSCASWRTLPIVSRFPWR